MSKNILSRCVYDVDNRYVDLSIRSEYGNEAFTLVLSDTSDDQESDTEIEMYLTKEDLKLIIDRLSKELENASSNSSV